MEPLRYSESEFRLWEDELEEFVPARVFDAYVHLWSNEHLQAGLPADPQQIEAISMPPTGGTRGFFLDVPFEYLVLAKPGSDVDTRRQNR